MKIKKNLLFFASCLMLCALLITSGCGPKYKPKPISPFQGVSEKKTGIEASARKLSRYDAAYYFSHDIAQKGYQAIQLCIRNTTGNAYMLDANNIDLPIEPAESVAKDLHYNTAGRVLGWGVASLFVWPFIIPAAVDGYQSYKANQSLSRDFDRRVIDEHSRVIITPKSVMNKIIFVSLDQAHKQACSLKIIDKESGKNLSFNLAL